MEQSRGVLPVRGEVLVSIIDPALVGEEAARAALRPEEEELAARFRFEKDARHWRACRAALRRILGGALGIGPRELVLVSGEFGKPALEAPHQGLHFNLSHCEDLALVALCVDGPVGVDIEAAGRAASLLGCETTFCHPDEIRGLPSEEGRRAAALLEIWTRKEALLKALGTGMSLAPETVSLVEAGPHPRLRPFRVQTLAHPLLTRHIARLATLRESSNLRFDVFQG